MSLFCFLGFHKWEKEPSHKELIKATGKDMVFWSEGIQKARKKCIHEECGAVKKVFRRGWFWVGGTSTSWKALSKKNEKYIDSLSTL